MQSLEYPDLLWVPPRSWTNANRTSVQLVVIHTTEGAARALAAEDGAAYDARRTDGTSTHYFHDSNSTVQCVLTADQAHTARAQGNRRGIQHELCTRGGSADWFDAYHTAMLRRAAKQAARDAKKWGIPVRKLTPAQVNAGVKGFCGHADITKAFPEDGGTHTDPGSSFPWGEFLTMVAQELAPPEPVEEDVAFTADDKKWLTGEITRIVREELTTMTDYIDDLGGKGAGAGRAVLNSGYPRIPGEKRAPAWSNLSKDSQVLDRVEVKLDALAEVLNEKPPTQS